MVRPPAVPAGPPAPACCCCVPVSSQCSCGPACCCWYPDPACCGRAPDPSAAILPDSCVFATSRAPASRHLPASRGTAAATHPPWLVLPLGRLGARPPARPSTSAWPRRAAGTPSRCYWTPGGRTTCPSCCPPSRGKAPRDREYRVVDWRIYRQLFQQDTGGRDLLQLVAENARAATVVTKAQQGQPVPDIQHLALRAARRCTKWQALKRAQPELWTVFRTVDAVCKRHARGRRDQGWVSVCVSIDSSRDGTRAWRLLKCLLMVPRALNQVLSLAVHLTIQAADLAEKLADQFAARDVAQLPAAPPPAALPGGDTCRQRGKTEEGRSCRPDLFQRLAA
ncbi:hypothetical protein MTO96_049748 [Rhipicephalus appendiculatus]